MKAVPFYSFYLFLDRTFSSWLESGWLEYNYKYEARNIPQLQFTMFHFPHGCMRPQKGNVVALVASLRAPIYASLDYIAPHDGAFIDATSMGHKIHMFVYITGPQGSDSFLCSKSMLSHGQWSILAGAL